MTTETMTPQSIAADIAREYREDGSRWIQGRMARTAAGRDFICDANPAGAVCWCLRGAIDKRLGEDEDDFSTKVYLAFDSALGFKPDYDAGESLHFVEWNDKPGRTVGEVIQLCEKVAAS